MVKLEKLTENNLSQITGWFNDPVTQKFLSGMDWIANALSRTQQAIGKTYRGAKVINRIGFVAYDGESPVGYIEAEVYDKRTVISGLTDDKQPIIALSEDKITAAIVYTVNPTMRNKGYSAQIIQALINHPDMMSVKVFVAGTEPENIFSYQSLQKVGFIKQNAEPDFEGVFNWVLTR